MFSKRPSQQPVDVSGIMVTTTENVYGRPYEVLGPVISEQHRSLDDEDFKKMNDELRMKAHRKGADAVVGVRLATRDESGFSRMYAYGTAVRFVNKEGDSE